MREKSEKYYSEIYLSPNRDILSKICFTNGEKMIKYNKNNTISPNEQMERK
jgi:hypothetical protein